MSEYGWRVLGKGGDGRQFEPQVDVQFALFSKAWKTERTEARKTGRTDRRTTEALCTKSTPPRTEVMIFVSYYHTNIMTAEKYSFYSKNIEL